MDSRSLVPVLVLIILALAWLLVTQPRASEDSSINLRQTKWSLPERQRQQHAGTTDGGNDANGLRPVDGTSPSNGVNIDLLMRNAAAKQVERDAWFESSHKSDRESLAKTQLNTFLGGLMLQATSTCPVDLLKTTSVKRLLDGGKWLCGLSRVKAIAASGRRPVVYSLGCQFQVDFEMRLQDIAGGACDIHTYDPTMKPPERVQAFAEKISKSGIQLHEIAASGIPGRSKLTINKKEYEAQSLDVMMAENGHSCIDVLKFDVEGAEHGILETDWASMCVGMLSFEIHGGLIAYQQKTSRNWPNDRQYYVADGVRVVRKLEQAGFLFVMSEQVYTGGNAQAELSFVNVSWLAANDGAPSIRAPSKSAAEYYAEEARKIGLSGF